MPTSLLDEIKADQNPRSQCKACVYIESLPPKEQAEWDKAMSDRSFTSTSVHRALTRRNVGVGKGSVESHRSNRHRPI